MANVLTNIMPQILARGLMSLREQCVMPRLVNYDYSTEAAEKGSTIDVPIPTAVGTRDVTPSNTPPAPTDATPAKVQVTLENWKQNDPFYLTDKQLVEIEKNRHFVPMQVSEAIRALAADVNISIHNQYTGVYGFTGTPGTTPFASTAADAVNARKILNAQLCPKVNRRGVLDFDAEANALLLSTFADAEKIGSNGVKIEGEIGKKYGTQWLSDDHVLTHTAGTITTGLICKASTAVAVGAKTLVATTAASTGACALVVGDIITFAGDTQTYVLTAAATQASAASDVTLAFEPGLKVAKVGSEAITVKGNHVVNLVFHRDAFAFATRPLVQSSLDMALGSKIVSMQDPKTGLVLRLEVSRQHKQVVWEFDILWGVKLVRPELACRIAG